MCQEELLKSAKRDQKKRVENKIKEEIKPDETEFKELEYRTIEWDKDALYFSYEPSFLFVDEDNEDGGGGEDEFVCECCDPKKKKKVWSEDVSEVEEENEETDGLLSDSEEEVDDSPCQSREDSPTIGASRLSEKSGNANGKNGNAELSTRLAGNGDSPTKPMAPGWFGKGKRRRGKLK